jgi:hypothetical protein
MKQFKISIWEKQNPGSVKEIFVEAASEIHVCQMASASMQKGERATFEEVDGSKTISES